MTNIKSSGLEDTMFGLKSLRLAKPLRPGFVVTIEPGIYFIPTLFELWRAERKFKNFINYDLCEKYMGFGGVRIEDDVLVTKDGCEILTKDVPKEADEIEKLMRKKAS